MGHAANPRQNNDPYYYGWWGQLMADPGFECGFQVIGVVKFCSHRRCESSNSGVGVLRVFSSIAISFCHSVFRRSWSSVVALTPPR